MHLEFPPEIKLLAGWRPASEPMVREGFWHWKVYLESARKIKTAGYAEWGQDDFTPGKGLHDLLLRLYRHRNALEAGRLSAAFKEQTPAQNLIPEETANLLVKAGWLILWVRLKADGLSPLQTQFYRGPKLTASLNEAKISAAVSARAWTKRLTKKWQAIEISTEARSNSQGSSRENSREKPMLLEQPMTQERLRLLKQLRLLEQLKITSRGLLDKTGAYLKGESPAPPHLPEQPRKAFDPANMNNFFAITLEFWTALAGAIAASPDGFDWKEIGAGYHQAIGGSKLFDRQRDNLVLYTEEIFNVSLAETGLISRGSLYSIYLAGSLVTGGQAATSIQAVTNIQVEEAISFKTPATQLILTENRALLLKMHKSGWLKKRPDILVLGIDGRLRTAHKRLLTLITENNQISGISAWVDTDTAGIEIAAALAVLCPGMAMVLPPAAGHAQQTVQKEKTLPYQEWVNWLAQHTEYVDIEQEEMLGDEALWGAIWPMLLAPADSTAPDAPAGATAPDAPADSS